MSKEMDRHPGSALACVKSTNNTKAEIKTHSFAYNLQHFWKACFCTLDFMVFLKLPNTCFNSGQ